MSKQDYNILNTFAAHLHESGYFIINIGPGKYRLFHTETQSVTDGVEGGITTLYQDWRSTTKPESGAKFLSRPAIEYIRQQLPVASGTRFEPGQPIIFGEGLSKALNTYKTYKAKDALYDLPEVPQQFLSLMHSLFPEDAEREVVTQWLAHMFQRPEERPSWHLLLTSDTGTGKGFLFHKILRPLLANQAAIVSSYDKIAGAHNEVLADNMLIMLDDVKTKSDSMATKLKSILTEPSQMINPKGETAYMANIYARFILASNERHPLVLDDNERRWYVPEYIRHWVSSAYTKFIVSALQDYISEYGLDAIYAYFMTYDISQFDPYQPVITDTLKTMQEASKPKLLQDLEEFLVDNAVFHWEKDLMQDDRFKHEQPNLMQKYLSNLGYKQKQLDVEYSGKRSKYWCHVDLKPRCAIELYHKIRNDSINSKPFPF